MNITYHAIVGLTLDCTMKTFPISTISSIVPDFPLIKNEVGNFLNGRRFDEWRVSKSCVNFYFLTHSIFIPIALSFFTSFWIGYGVHILCDLFTHSGRFTARPFFPISHWRFPWGRNILK